MQYLRIWHDCTGAGSFHNWYLNKVVVVDCQSTDKYPFIVDRWLAPDKDDGLVCNTAFCLFFTPTISNFK